MTKKDWAIAQSFRFRKRFVRVKRGGTASSRGHTARGHARPGTRTGLPADAPGPENVTPSRSSM
jgi:hypothetical protein